MKLAFQLAYKNLIGAGLRTWLNVAVLAFAYIIIVFFNGFLEGWNTQAKQDSIAWEYGHGHVVHEAYDSGDPFTIQDGHGVLTSNQKDNLTPILIRQAAIYPDGRMLSVLLKGIEVDQHTLAFPTEALVDSEADLPVIIGERMAETAKLQEGEEVLLRWRDKNGTFDAANITIAKIFDTDVMTVDKGQVWMDIEKLWAITGLQQHATLYVAKEQYEPTPQKGWTYESQASLLSIINEIIQSKKISNAIVYLLLLAIALLAIFDTQVLSVFRRQKEIGTYVALGMTRQQVVGIFTVEGSMYSLFAMVIGLLIGIPLFGYLATTGIAMPSTTQEMGVSIAERIFPVFGIQLVISTIILVVLAATVVSFLPARKIARMNTVDALKGKLQ